MSMVVISEQNIQHVNILVTNQEIQAHCRLKGLFVANVHSDRDGIYFGFCQGVEIQVIFLFLFLLLLFVRFYPLVVKYYCHHLVSHLLQQLMSTSLRFYAPIVEIQEVRKVWVILFFLLLKMPESILNYFT